MKKLHAYEITFRLKKGVKEKGKYGTEYGFGFNPPAVIFSKNLIAAKKQAKKKCPKDCVISSVRREK